jgi:hypothetical protein
MKTGFYQQTIVSELQRTGHAVYLADLARRLWQQRRLDPSPNPPRALSVTVRRAAKLLARRGAIQLGMAPVARARGGQRLACWLPGQDPPQGLACGRLTGAEVEVLLLELLREAPPMEVATGRRDANGRPVMTPVARQLPLATLKRQALQRASPWTRYPEGWAQQAVRRALTRLVRAYRISIERQALDWEESVLVVRLHGDDHHGKHKATDSPSKGCLVLTSVTDERSPR